MFHLELKKRQHQLIQTNPRTWIQALQLPELFWIMSGSRLMLNTEFEEGDPSY